MSASLRISILKRAELSLADCIDNVSVADAAIIRELLDYLKTWLDHHILIQDMAYKPYVQHNCWAREVSRVFGPALADEAPADVPCAIQSQCLEIESPLQT